MWEEWRDEELKRGGMTGDKKTAVAASPDARAPYPSATKLSCADVVLCSVERLAEVGAGGMSADERLARSIRWSQVRKGILLSLLRWGLSQLSDVGFTTSE